MMYNNYSPYYYQPQPQRFQSTEQQTQSMGGQQYISPMQMAKPMGLLGKSVDSIEVVKATDIPLDGSISYFPLTDGSAIVTKQLQMDGTSRTVVYKPIQEESKEVPKPLTIEDVRKEIDAIDLSELDDIKDELKDIRKQLKDIKKTKGE